MATEQTRKQVVQRWLREHLVRLVNVQRVSLGQSSITSDPVREADLVVYTWAGVMIYIHLIDEAIKTPKVRRILENATGTGIVTLFILDAAFLPKPGEPFEGNKWFLPFQYLANDRVYTYDLQGMNPVIRPARFVATSRNEFEIQYGDEVFIQQIRHLRQTAKHSALKGYWFIGDFETERSVNHPGFRSNSRTHHRSNGTGANPSSNNQAHHNSEPQKSRLDVSYELLGVSRDASREDVKLAFRKRAFEVHPDVSQLPKDEAEARFKVLSEAYEMIKTMNAWT